MEFSTHNINGNTVIISTFATIWTKIWKFGNNNNILWRSFIGFAKLLTAISVEDGAKTSIHLASSDEVKDITGKFFANSQVKKGSSKAKNEEHNLKLWELSEEFVKPFL